mmetsp:Transcript_38682/g.91265  ORF Transcript_38682/g.91265 Transcript_38682/m.91265 type:complete len:271 (+) Transcript_38682:119-931(+)
MARHGHHGGGYCNIFMRMRASNGENAYFKDDRGRFTADINRTNTLKLRCQSQYKVSLECPKNMRVVSMSIQGAAVEMEEMVSHKRQSDGEKILCVGVWRTHVFFPTETSNRDQVEFIFVLQVDGLKGPASDERHLLKTKCLCKFYAPEYHKYNEKGHALGAIRLRCQIGDTSKITSVAFADLEHTEALQGEGESESTLYVTAKVHEKNNTKPLTIIQREGDAASPPPSPKHAPVAAAGPVEAKIPVSVPAALDSVDEEAAGAAGAGARSD